MTESLNFPYRLDLKQSAHNLASSPAVLAAEMGSLDLHLTQKIGLASLAIVGSIGLSSPLACSSFL